jgi:hypothetical protein
VVKALQPKSSKDEKLGKQAIALAVEPAKTRHKAKKTIRLDHKYIPWDSSSSEQAIFLCCSAFGS